MLLPTEYVSYFDGDGLKEGALSVEPGWFQLWAPGEIEQLNLDYHVDEFAPGFVGFGSSGGGELFAFDASEHVVMIPFVGMCVKAARPVSASWSEFVEKIEH